MYKVNQFIISKNSNEAIVQNATKITIIKNKNIQNLLEYVDENNVRVITETELRDYIDATNFKEVIDFLISSKILTVETERKLIGERYISYSNNKVYNEFLLNNEGPFEIVNDFDDLSDVRLVILYLNPFSLKALTELTDKINEQDIPLVASFSYNCKNYISNLYKYSWHNPCPKCMFYNIETTLRSFGQMSSVTTYQTIVDLIYKKYGMFEAAVPMDLNATISLVNELNSVKYLPPAILAKRTTALSMDRKSSFDIATHWDLCTCIDK